MWDPEEPDPDPGPGSYELKTSMGKQFASNYATTPQWSITSKHAKSWAKVYAGPGSDKVRRRREPGPELFDDLLDWSNWSIASL